MAFVSGLGGGGGHVNTTYTERRNSILSRGKFENCGCIPFGINIKESKKQSRIRLMKERMRQFSIWFFEMEDQREIEHAKRRLERKRRKRMPTVNKKRCLLFLYWFDAILWIVGTVFTLCSSIKTFGKNTFFYKSRYLYRILGPGLLFAAVLMLFVATGLKHWMRRKQTKTHRNFFIVQKKKKSPKPDKEKKDPDNDSGNEEDIEMTGIKKQKPHAKKSEDKENLAFAKSVIKSDKGWSDEFTLECTKLVTEHEAEQTKSKRFKDRRAWAKTKWMRVDKGSDEETEFGEVIDLTPMPTMENRDEKTGTVEHTDIDKIPAFSEKRRITRFKPKPGSCFTAQSSIRSQASEASFVSTTSETSPLVRK